MFCDFKGQPSETSFTTAPSIPPAGSRGLRGCPRCPSPYIFGFCLLFAFMLLFIFRIDNMGNIPYNIHDGMSM